MRQAVGGGLADAVSDPANAGRFLPFMQIVNSLPRMSPATLTASAAVTLPATVSCLGAVKTVSGMAREVWNRLLRSARGARPQPGVPRELQLPPLAGELNRAVQEWTGAHAPELHSGVFVGANSHTVSPALVTLPIGASPPHCRPFTLLP